MALVVKGVEIVFCLYLVELGKQTTTNGRMVGQDLEERFANVADFSLV